MNPHALARSLRRGSSRLRWPAGSLINPAAEQCQFLGGERWILVAGVHGRHFHFFDQPSGKADQGTVDACSWYDGGQITVAAAQERCPGRQRKIRLGFLIPVATQA